MDFSTLKKVEEVYPMFIRKFQSFTPVSDNASVTEKLNSMVLYLNEIGKLSNVVVNNWNQVIKWVQGDGLKEVVGDINEQLAHTMNQMEQNNFSRLSGYSANNSRKPQYRILGDRNLSFWFPLKDGESICYHLQKDDKDDFIKEFEVAIHETTLNSLISQENYDQVSVTMSGFPGENVFTITVNATITHTFRGTGIAMQYYYDNRGGVWEAKIDGVVIKNISTHINAVPPGDIWQAPNARTLISDTLSDGEHTLVLTFLGDDPNFPPSTGAGTSRGWIKNNSQNNAKGRETFYIYGEGYSELFKMLHPSSNKEFAFSARPVASTTNAWFPEHSGVGTAFVGTSGYQKVIVDGVEVTDFTSTGYIDFSKAEIIQKLEWIYPDDGSLLAIIFMVTKITDGKVSHNGTIKFEQDTFIDTAYINMLPSNPSFGNSLTSSLNKVITTTATDGSTTSFGVGYPAIEYVYTDSAKPNYFVGNRIDSGISTLRVSQEGVGNTYVAHRSDGIQKLYPSIFSKFNVLAGESYRFAGTIFGGKLEGANFLISGR